MTATTVPARAEAWWHCDELYRMLVKTAPNFGVLMFDRRGRVVYWNRGAETIFGFTEAEVLGKDAGSLFIPEDNEHGVPEKEMKLALRDGHADDERWHLRKDGRRIWVSGVTSAVRNEAGDVVGFSKVVRENTLRKNTEDEIRAANSRLTQFAYMASHDLKEPLRMVTSFLGLLEKRLAGKIDDETAEFLGFALDGGRRMRVLIDTILEYSKVGVSRDELRPTDCNAVVDSAISFMKPIIQESEATVTRGALPLIDVFPVLLEQVFQNLISNAVKYRREEPPHVYIDAVDQTGEWLFSVRDNGMGIKNEYREKVFGEFQRLHRPEDYPGTGLGLAICRRIVERHEGRIWVESIPGEGSTFYFTLSKHITS